MAWPVEWPIQSREDDMASRVAGKDRLIGLAEWPVQRGLHGQLSGRNIEDDMVS